MYVAGALPDGRNIVNRTRQAASPPSRAREAVKKACGVVYDVHDAAKDKLYELEVASVCDEPKRLFVHVPEELIPPPPATTGSAAAAAP